MTLYEEAKAVWPAYLKPEDQRTQEEVDALKFFEPRAKQLWLDYHGGEDWAVRKWDEGAVLISPEAVRVMEREIAHRAAIAAKDKEMHALLEREREEERRQ